MDKMGMHLMIFLLIDILIAYFIRLTMPLYRQIQGLILNGLDHDVLHMLKVEPVTLSLGCQKVWSSPQRQAPKCLCLTPEHIIHIRYTPVYKNIHDLGMIVVIVDILLSWLSWIISLES